MMLTQSELDKILELITIDEDYKQFPYDDSTGLPVRILTGNITVGIGRNLSGRGLSKEEANYLAKNDITAAMDYLAWYGFFIDLCAPRKYILVNMVFNLGIPKFKDFKKLIAALYDKNYDKAADEIIDSNAARQLQARYQRLAKKMRSGEW